MATILHYDITIKGRVQGVGYRYFALRTAQSLGLKGYVKNNPDGSVFIEAEGDENILKKFVSHCKTGPGWAYVDQVNVAEFPIQGYAEFSIRH